MEPSTWKTSTTLVNCSLHKYGQYQNDTYGCHKSSWSYHHCAKLGDVDWTDAVDHFAEVDLASCDKALFILGCDAVRIAGQDNEVALGFAHEKRIIINRGDGCAPHSLVVPSNFNQLVLGAILAWHIFDDTYTLHEVSDYDHVVDDSKIDSLGDLSFDTFRAFRTLTRSADAPYRFVDGELIEKFLTCEPQLQEEIVADVGSSDVEEVKGMIEALRRLH